MKRDRRLSSGLVLTFCAVAAGCGPASVTMDSAGKMLAENKELSATTQLTSSLRTSGAGQTSRTESTFAVKKNSAGGVDVTAEGRTLSFTPANIQGTAWAKNGVPQQLVRAFGEDTSSAISASDGNFAQVWGYFHQSATEAEFGFAAVGNETPAASVPTTATASYVGTAGIIGRSTANPANTVQGEWGTTAAKAVNPSSEARLNVNFGSKVVTGNLSGGTRQVGNVLTPDPTIDLTLGTAPIVGNTFTGAATGQGVDGTSTYTGKFFGPNAEEAAGVIDMSAGAGTFLGAGGFHVTKQ